MRWNELLTENKINDKPDLQDIVMNDDIESHEVTIFDIKLVVAIALVIVFVVVMIYFLSPTASNIELSIINEMNNAERHISPITDKM